MPDVFVAPEDDVKETSPKPTKKAEKKNTSFPKKEETTSPVRMFSSFCPMPAGVQFENQEENETVQLFLRRHIVTNLRWVLLTLFLLILPLTVPFLLTLLGPFIAIPFRFALVVILFYYLIVLSYGFVNFITWFYNVGIITNIRVIDIDISHITFKNVATVSINDIVDVSYIQNSLFNNLFDYGDLHLQTEGLKPNFEFHAVPHPARVADIISDLTRGGRHE